MTAATIALGWYIPKQGKTPPRWLLMVNETHIWYSDSVTKRRCLHKTFNRWKKKHDAQLAQGVSGG